MTSFLIPWDQHPTHTEAGPTASQLRPTLTSAGGPDSLRRQIGPRSNGSDCEPSTSTSPAQASDRRPEANRFTPPKTGGSLKTVSIEPPPSEPSPRFLSHDLELLFAGSHSGSVPLQPAFGPLDRNIPRKFFQNPGFLSLTLLDFTNPPGSFCFFRLFFPLRLRSFLDLTRPIHDTFGDDGSDTAAGRPLTGPGRFGKSRIFAGRHDRRSE